MIIFNSNSISSRMVMSRCE